MSFDSPDPSPPFNRPSKRKSPEDRARELELKEQSNEIKSRQLLDRKLQFISKLHRSEYENRRRYEWRTLTAVLAVDLAVCAGPRAFGTHKTSVFLLAILAVGVLVVAKMAADYLAFIQERNDFNKALAEAAERSLILNTNDQSVINASVPNFERHTWSLKWEKKAIWAAAVFTVLVLVLLRFEA